MSDLKERIRGLKRCDVCKRAVRNAQRNELIDKDRLREEAILASLANKFVGNEVIADRPNNPR